MIDRPGAGRRQFVRDRRDIDYVIGRVLSALQDVNLYNDTLIVFTSDHGEFLNDHYAGGKVMFHESSARIPFILRLPKN